MGIQFEKIPFKGEDERGLTTEIDNEARSGPYILAYRNAGFWSGNHYHKGLSRLKDPEIVFLLSGSVELEFGDVLEGRVKEIEKQLIKAPSRIEISTHTWHKMTFLEDSCFLELNGFEEGDKDTFRLEA
ncbi:MAG: hypothetical protein LPK45_05100 [Bacteroidota bacterium]|nr:hypothetical protein [Bacteroidota bacterium]MDX5430437.1 hypothetical protein [Bacteroidota bacterium]MDX5469196.1 hypothetical protein [Bacteroidota bacterium]